MIIKALEWVIGRVFGALDAWDRKLDQTLKLPEGRIHLVAAPDEPSRECIQRCAESLATCGFIEAGVYDVLEIPGVRLFGLVQPDTAVTAAAWSAEGHLYLDLVTQFEDCTSLTFANHAVGKGLPRSPDQRLKRFQKWQPQKCTLACWLSAPRN